MAAVVDAERLQSSVVIVYVESRAGASIERIEASGRGHCVAGCHSYGAWWQRRQRVRLVVAERERPSKCLRRGIYMGRNCRHFVLMLAVR